MPRLERVKPKQWGQAGREKIFNLARSGLIDIEDTSPANIDSIREVYFKHRDIKNFRRNFRETVASYDLETEYSGARRREAGELRVCYFFD